MVVTLWARLPLLDPSFVPKVAKIGPSYGPHMVHRKSDFMKKNLAYTGPAPCHV